MDSPCTRAIALEIPRLRKLKGAYAAGALLKKTTVLALENNGCFAVLQYSRSVQTYLDLATIDRPPFLNVHISHYAAVDLLHRTVHSGAMPKQNKYIYGALQTGRLKKKTCAGAYIIPKGDPHYCCSNETLKNAPREARVAELSAAATVCQRGQELFVTGFSVATLDAVDIFWCAGRIPEGLDAASGQNGDGLPQ